MQFGEFTRRLEKAHLSNEAMFLLSHMFEVQVEFSKHLDLTLDLMEKLADRMLRSTQVNKEILEQVRALQQRNAVDGVTVHSVRNDPDDV